jgi:hypothetical protein
VDISHITDFTSDGRLYQAAAPDDGLITFQSQSPDRHTMLIEMAAGVDALHWVRQGTIKACLYFGIDDSPDCCLADDVLLSLARMGSAWIEDRGDVISGCGAGVSRSSYASCAILMMSLKIDFDQALAMIRHGRPQSNPNSGFVDHLRRMQQRLMAE